MSVAPVALFVYNRPLHVMQTVEALQNNRLSIETDLFIFSDAAKNPTADNAVQQVRNYIKSITGFKSVTIVERLKNLGLANSIIDGVSYLTNKFGRVIVLEDDLITSTYFLSYMNTSLDQYADDDRVISIHGYVYPVQQVLPEAFFLRGADCWGWATWQRGWTLFNSDGKFLLNELRRRKLTRLFDFNGAYQYVQMLKDQINGRNDSWAIRWYATAFLANKLTLYPGRSLVHNIGNDNSGTHCEDTRSHDVELSSTPINLNAIVVEPSQEAWHAFANFFRQGKAGLLYRFITKVEKCFRGGEKWVR